jgi:hypothetical protein
MRMNDARINAAVAKGRQRLLDTQPELQREADKRATDEAARSRNIDRMQLYEEEIEREIAQYASSQGIDVMDLLLRLGADSEDEARQLIEEHRKAGGGASGA